MLNKPSVSIGVDLAKAKFDVLMIGSAPKSRGRTFDNSAAGFAAFENWAGEHGAFPANATVTMESTGRYGERLCAHLQRGGWTIHVVNPARTAAFAKSLGHRSKTDLLDAEAIARFGLAHADALGAWVPADPRIMALRGLLRRRAQLREMATMEKNIGGDLDPKVDRTLAKLNAAHLAFIERQIARIDGAMKRLVEDDAELRPHFEHLTAMVGVGELTALELICHVLGHDFDSARACAAHAGLTPAHRQSGSSLNGKPHLSRQGDAHIRRALYMPALSIVRRAGPMADWFKSLVARGKAPLAAVCAVMRKLIHIAYGIIKGGKPYDPTLAFAPMPGAA